MRAGLWIGFAGAWACVVVGVVAHVNSTDAPASAPSDAPAPVAGPVAAPVAEPVSWDASYPPAIAKGGELCPHSSSALVVTKGKFWVPYLIGGVAVGRIDGTVQPDGTATGTATFRQPFSADLRKLMKRHYDLPLAQVPVPLADIHDVSVTFTRVAGKPHVAIAIASQKWSKYFGCELAFGEPAAAPPPAQSSPASAGAPAVAEHAPVAAPAAPAAPAARDTSAERERDLEAKRQAEKESHRSDCISACGSIVRRCNDRCQEDSDKASRRCNDESSSCEEHTEDHTPCQSDWGHCISQADSTRDYTCTPRCTEDASSCMARCNE